MSVEQNKKMAERLPVEISKGNFAVLDEVIDPKAVDHALPPGMPPTAESTKQFFMGFRAAFPDLKYKVEDTIAEGDYVVQRVTGTGTMKGACSRACRRATRARLGRKSTSCASPTARSSSIGQT